MTHPQDANDLLMSGGIPSVKWDGHQMGHTVIGTIVDQPKAVQMTKYQSPELAFWPSGDPMMQIVVTITTDLRDPANVLDDGKRRLHISPRMMKPVREAVQRAGAKGLAIGGRIAVRWISGTGQGEGNAREFAAEYAPPVVDPGSLLGPNGNTAPPVPPPVPGAHPTIKDTWRASDATRFPELHQAAPAPGLQPVPTTVALGSMLAGNGTVPAAQAGPPVGVDPGVWAALPDAQRNAVLAAMTDPAASAPAF